MKKRPGTDGVDGIDGIGKVDGVAIDGFDGADLHTGVDGIDGFDGFGIHKHVSLTEYDVVKAIFKKLNSIDNNQIIALPDKHGLHFVQINKIMRCHSDNSYTEFFIDAQNEETNEPQKLVVSRGFDEFEKFLKDKGPFFRIHNRHLVNINYINKYVKDDSNYVLLNDKHQTKIPVARARRLQFLQFLKKEGYLL